jgi:hypothetical protein
MSTKYLRRKLSLGVVVLVGCAVAGAFLYGALSWAARSHATTTTPVYAFPIPGARVAAPSTQITFRGISADQLGSIVVTGSSSGIHAGQVMADSDGSGGSFLPAAPFKPGEHVTVTTNLNIVGGSAGSFSFTVASPAGRIPGMAPRRPPRVRGDIDRFASDPQLIPAAVHVTKLPSHASPGGIFVAPQNGPAQEGPMILGPYGGLIWFKPVPRGESATDFRVQTYEGKAVLTWWQGRASAAGTGVGIGEIYDSAYQHVATVAAGNGLSSDLHELQITPQDTALITAFYPVYWNASSIGGSKREVVVDSVAQEIDVKTGLVLFQWDSLDHVPLTYSYDGVPKVGGHPYDYFHINSVQQDTDGNLIISSRDTWAAYKVNHQTGATMWELNGKHSSFKMGKDTEFAFQHDVRMRRNNQLTVFDDGAGPPVVHKQSRALTLKLDTTHMKATLANQDEHRPALSAAYEGNTQLLPNGDDFVGWGQQPYLSEYNERGRLVFDARFVNAISSYRAYRFSWTGTPTQRPGIAARVKGSAVTVYASWNGSTRLNRWRVLGGGSADSLKPVAGSRKQAFETAIRLRHFERYVAVQALDSHGRVLATSKPDRVP